MDNNQKGGFSLGTLIFVIFLILKLTHTGTVANWSWWWVTSPLWIPIGIGAILLILAILLRNK